MCTRSYVDAGVVAALRGLPLPLVTDPRLGRAAGDKRVLRAAAAALGLPAAASAPKRAAQFGTRLARAHNVAAFGSNRAGTRGGAAGVMAADGGGGEGEEDES